MHTPDTPFVGAADDSCYSIKREFDQATVLITGASGYIGSLLVEQLLRTTNVRRVYVLIRGKRGAPATERLERILHSGLFHLVRDDKALLQKVQLLEGDLNSDSLGLSASDQARALSEVDILVHSAASIELEADVQHTLRSNYQGTRRLLAFASRMTQLRCFLHVSTAYVNVNQPRGSSIQERIYPLKLGQQPIVHADIVEDLLSLEPDEANCRAQMYLDMWGFPNTYTMGKHLTEQLVVDFHRQGLPMAIVRPTLVCGLAGQPYPGFCGNLAGPIGMGVATAIGLFDHLDSVAMVPTHVWDAVPSDMVTSVILAAAAATAAGVKFNEYQGSEIGSDSDPMIVHAGTSTTYPISFAEAAWAGLVFIKNNPPPFRLPGGSLFKIPLDYRPDEKAVERRKAITAWKVWVAVKLLETLGQHKTAKRLKYGHICWAIQNNAKTDRNLFFGSRNLRALDANLAQEDADSGHYMVTFTLKNGGWPRYIATNLAGLYRMVFGITELRGIKFNDFVYIGAKTPEPSTEAEAAAAADDTQPLNRAPDQSAKEELDIVEKGLHSTASMFASIPASGASLEGLATTHTGSKNTTHDFVPLDPHLEDSFRSASADDAVLNQTRSENAGGLRAVLSHKLAATLSQSYAPADKGGRDTYPLRDVTARAGRKND